jgi:hypothetical protein
MNILYVEVEGSDGVAVILDGCMVYHEDSDKGYSNENFSAREVAAVLTVGISLVTLFWSGK